MSSSPDQQISDIPDVERAQILGEALDWIRQGRGSIVVIKYGGHAMIDPEAGAAFARDVQFLWQVGFKPVVVHGGGPQVTAMMGRLGIETPFVNGVRVTTPEAMEVVRMVLTGQVQRNLVAQLNVADNLAVGLSGEDGALFRARRRTGNDENGNSIDYGLVGDIIGVDPGAVLDLLDSGRIPIISSIALDVDDPSGVLNINADAAASALSVALKAAKLLILTDVEGIYRNYPDPDSLISSIAASELRELGSVISAGMIPKVRCCLEAIDGGVGKVHIVDGRLSHSVLIELMTDRGTGTMIEPDPATDLGNETTMEGQGV